MLTDPTFMLSMTQSYNHYHIALYVFLAIGILITLGAFFGCMGVCRESQCLLVSVSRDTFLLKKKNENQRENCTSCIFHSAHMCLKSVVNHMHVYTRILHSLKCFAHSLFIVEFSHPLIHSFIKLFALFTVLLCHTHCNGSANSCWSLGFPQQR